MAPGDLIVVEEVGPAGHPPVLDQVHRPQDEVDALAVLVPRPVQVHRELRVQVGYRRRGRCKMMS